MDDTRPTIRVDKWLWHARFFKTRTLAATIVKQGKVRVDSNPISKPARTVGPGDVLTFVQATNVRVVRILDIGERRGPAPEAQALYEDLSPPEEKPVEKASKNPSFDGKGRPGKRERRNMASHLSGDGPFGLE